ncbi:phosphoribosylanthranilate isomerase [soil metagenome]
MTLVKICGLTNYEDARLAIDLGADALGFIHERTSPRYIGDDIPKWLNDLPPFTPKVAVFGRVDRVAHASVFDLVQGVEWETYTESAAKRILALRLRPGQTARDLINQTINAGALMLDAYRPEAWGGTGHRVDWDVAAEIVQRATKPVILAGGLNAENVADAVRRVRPYAVDVSSGIEKSPGVKDREKLAAFIEAAKSA